MKSKQAVVLLSGGLDSSTVLAMANDKGFSCHALSFEYGQRHNIELACAKNMAKTLGVASHVISRIDLSAWGGSALTADIEVPKDGRDSGIPITYVPARNTIFLSHALGFAEAIGARDIFIGVNAVDYSGYPDCRGEFVEAFQTLANLATKAGVEGDSFTIHAPLLEMTKVDIIKRGHELGVDYSLTQSCYDPSDSGNPCGQCDACRLRDAAFFEIA
ncbi:MAG: 7-cyano-7-deazaguanine synthase QueC [Phycisphaerae bacterium]|nr:7-cyano-7-deazaguanine synthase QueC [Phycisphaerae bacterium]|tara:strand:- start:7862 stop:8512 length:651 start_codon:yes stop_codon:yes gene_type:complete